MVKTTEKIVLDKKYLEELKRKASLLEEILAFLEDEYLGFLMEKTEKEKNIPLSKAKKILSK
jgi:predicted house-cleaning noncanonical NTP pyrophosphatase (MazG superfamily)